MLRFINCYSECRYDKCRGAIFWVGSQTCKFFLVLHKGYLRAYLFYLLNRVAKANCVCDVCLLKNISCLTWKGFIIDRCVCDFGLNIQF